MTSAPPAWKPSDSAERRELRAFDADVGPPVAAGDLFGLRRGDEPAAQERRDRMGHRDMRDAAVAEEAGLAPIGAILELVDHHEHAGIELAVERAAGRERDDVGDAGPLQRVDIGAIIDRRGREAMAPAMARQEHRLRVAHPPEAQRVGGIAPGGGDSLFPQILRPGRS